jgi:aspartate/methionine/tyrosine aminotransferase
MLADHANLQPGDRRFPVALCAAPSWDYAGPLTAAGYHMRYYPTGPANGWLPRAEDIHAAVADIASNRHARLGLVVINAQHNPTGRSLPQGTLDTLFEVALAHGAGILLDDPYYEVRTLDATPVAAPAALLRYLDMVHASARARRRWCAVRSLGKQFAANGFAVGTLTSQPDLLPRMLDRAFARRFPANAHHEWAIAEFLSDRNVCDGYLAEQRASLTRKRTLLAATLTSQGWPGHLVTVGEVSPYMLVPVPPAWAQRSVEEYRQHLLAATGVLVAPASIENNHLNGAVPCVRFYLGGGDEVTSEIARRMVAAGIRYDQPYPGASRPAGTSHSIAPDSGRDHLRRRAATELRVLAGFAHHRDDADILQALATWLCSCQSPATLDAAAEEMINAMEDARWATPPTFEADTPHSVCPVRVPDRASVLLAGIAEHIAADCQAPLRAAARAVAQHHVVDEAFAVYLQRSLSVGGHAGAGGIHIESRSRQRSSNVASGSTAADLR